MQSDIKRLSLILLFAPFALWILLLIIIHLFAKLLKPYTQREASALTSHRPPDTRRKKTPDDNQRLTAIISAAVAAHRKRIGRHSQP